MNNHWRRYVLIIGPAAAIVIVILFQYPARHNPATRTFEASTSRPIPKNTAATARPRDREGDSTDDALFAVKHDTPREATPKDLLAKGFPPRPNPRGEVYDRMVKHSIEDTIRDLGNLMAVSLSSIHGNLEHDGVGYYRCRITHDLRVIRLIEAGRADPERVGSLVLAEIHDQLKGYDAVAKSYLDNWYAKTPNRSSISMKNPYYEANRKYEDPNWEFRRRDHVIAAGIYILLAIGREVPVDAIVAWTSVSKPPGETNRNGQYVIWLLGQLYRQDKWSGTQAAKNFAAITHGMVEADKDLSVSKWQQPWEMNDPLLIARKGNTSGIETIAIPAVQAGKYDLEEAAQARLIAEFTEEVRRRQGDIRNIH